MTLMNSLLMFTQQTTTPAGEAPATHCGSAAGSDFDGC